MKQNKFGVLLAISSLPGNHGIGDFGRSAYEFVDFLKEKGYRYWQILPLNPVGVANSPYMSTCSEAIDFRYIDLDTLVEEGLLESAPKHVIAKSVNYDKTKELKEKYLLKAFENFLKNPSSEYKKFIKENHWVYPYSIYSVVRKEMGFACWNKWPEEWKYYYNFHSSEDIPLEYEKDCKFQMFEQFIAHKQWEKLRKYANKNGIKIIADCPFYVGLDSVDCWLHKDQFIMDPKYNPTLVSGCPPDAFSDDGQLWGTPIFDFAKMEKDNYTFLIHRISYLASTCDLLRLDHFRAWDTYCIIPASDENAKRGEWWIGPRTKFFDILFAKYPKINLIAEDLGILFDSVHELRNHYKLPGMFITEFTILDEHAKSNENTIVYPGTHDNVPIEGWVKTLSKKDKKAIKKKLGNPEDLPGALLDYTRDLPSKITVFSMQDLLRLNEKATMNRPGTVGSPNWEWKLKDNSYMNEIKVDIKA